MANTITYTLKNGRSVIRFEDSAGKLVCVAFRVYKGTGINAYFHQDYDKAWETIEDIAEKPDLEKNPDDYRLMRKFRNKEKPEAMLEELKTILREAVKANPEVFEAEKLSITAYKPKAKAPAKTDKPEDVSTKVEAEPETK